MWNPFYSITKFFNRPKYKVVLERNFGYSDEYVIYEKLWGVYISVARTPDEERANDCFRAYCTSYIAQKAAKKNKSPKTKTVRTSPF